MAIGQSSTASTISAPAPLLSFIAYDAGGLQAFALDRLTSITEGGNSHTFVYDNFGRIKSDSQLIDTKTYLISYAYNLASQITSITYPSTTRVITQSYDAIGRVCSIGASGATCTSGTRYLTSPNYNAAGETLGFTLGNNVQGNFTYNDHLQLATLRYFKSGVNTDVLNLSYDYTSTAQPNNNGQIQTIHYFTQPGTEDQTKSESFTYDQLGRLKAAQTLTVNSNPGTWSLQWTYDRFGNRLSQSLVGGNVTIGQPNFTVDTATNHIVGYCYDGAGNLLDTGSCPQSNHLYTYDGANRLTRINGTGPAYSYFGSQRIKKVVGSTTTRYIYSGGKPIAEYLNGAAVTSPSTEYIYVGSQLLVTIAGSSTTYHHPDHLSNRAETNSSGTVIRTAGPFPFGDGFAYETGTTNKWKFTGYEHDSGTGETGLDYANFRYYSSAQARFLSADLTGGKPGTPRSLNRYTYTLDDPINKIDPLGLFDEPFETCFITSGEGYVDKWCEGHETDTHEPPDYSNLGGSDHVGLPLPDKLFNILLNCILKQFKVFLTDFTQSSGRGTGRPDDNTNGTATVLFVGDPSIPLTVTNDITSKAVRDQPTPDELKRSYSGDTGIGIVPGWTDSRNPFTNYTLNGVIGPGAVDTQIWELGNSLALIEGTMPSKLRAPSDDPGAELLDCYLKGTGQKKWW
jgi:RHS repeat-associated protein